MNACAALDHAAGLEKYGIATSNMPCLVTHRLVMALPLSTIYVTARRITAALLETRLFLLGFRFLVMFSSD